MAYFPVSISTLVAAVGDGAAPLYNKIAVSTGVLVSVGAGISLVNATSAACHEAEGTLMLWPKELQRETVKSMVAVIACDVSKFSVRHVRKKGF